ncbi:MAG TPA: hypothetical protein VGQ57_19665 [Polyangiaceae bacterium]|nr:hypothetical protein [Polyangiaceae bacterium]
MAMSHDQPQRAVAVLPPPPSTPDDGPTALELPPLEPPPKSLQVAVRRAPGGFPLRTWLWLALLFVAGTALAYFLEY